MPYVTVDDGFPDHPKAIGLSDPAVACWLRGLCYASRYLTDGALPKVALPRLGKQRAAAELVTAGLWEVTETGWQIHDYHQRQRTRAEVDAIAETKAQAGTLGNHKRWHVSRGVVAEGCKWCRKPVAGATTVPSDFYRKASPESEAEAESEAESEADRETRSASLSFCVGGARRDPKVVAALEWMAEDDLQTFIANGGDVMNPTAYRASCLRTRIERDGPDLDRVAAELPYLTPDEMRTELEDRRYLA